jgi:hypothetical protein
MFCMQCGQQLPDVARFCMKCGSEVPSVTSNQKGEKPTQKNSTPFTPQREDEINRALLGVIADSLENGSLKQSDRNPIADFWERKADSIKTEDDLLSLSYLIWQRNGLFFGHSINLNKVDLSKDYNKRTRRC